jgi:hypothetical protein
MNELKVLFIIGKGRSGSTILDNVLGQVDGFVSLGELWVWRSTRVLEEQNCGCGQRAAECPFWSKALQLAYRKASAEGLDTPTPQDILRWQTDTAGWSRVPKLLRQPRRERGRSESLDELVRFAAALYRAVARISGARVIVDSSKWPANPGPLGLVPGIRPYAVHLIRDPRAVAFSWQREKLWSESGEPMPKQNPIYSSFSWIARNLLAERICARLGPGAMRLRYEDFVDDPADTLRRIVRLVDSEPAKLPLRDERTAILGSNHTLMGNPSRFATGPVEIRSDDEWTLRLGRRDCLLITGVTMPLLLRYGYPIHSAPPGRRPADTRPS